QRHDLGGGYGYQNPEHRKSVVWGFPRCTTAPVKPSRNWRSNQNGKPVLKRTVMDFDQDAHATMQSKRSSTVSATRRNMSWTRIFQSASTRSATKHCYRN